MRKLIIFILLSIASQALAQTERGSFILGGQVSFYRSNSKYENGSDNKYNATGFQVAPAFMYFPLNRLALGIQTPYSFVSSYFESLSQKSEGHSNSYAIGPVVRYYFSFGKLALFPELSYLRQWTWSNSTFVNFDPGLGGVYTSENKYEQTTRTISVGAGLVYFVKPNVGLEGILKYKANKMDANTESKSNDLNFSIGLQFYFTR